MKTKKHSLAVLLISLVSLLLMSGCWGSNEAKEFSVQLGTELPHTISTLSISSQKATKKCDITAITVEKKDSSYAVLISGKKTYDASGEDTSSECYFTWELCNESDEVVGSGMGKTPSLKTGETFTDEELIFLDSSDFPGGTYTFKIRD